MLSARAYSKLPTEQPNPRTRDIDRRSTFEIVRLINAEDRRVPLAVARVSRDVARGADALADSLRRGGGIYFVGAGTSGRLGVLEAAECPPTFNTTSAQIRAVIAGGRGAVFHAREGSEDDARAGGKVGARLSSRDALVGIAASGVTPFVKAALSAARARGARTLLVTSNGRPQGVAADILIAPNVGPEVVTGSTRLKSGTAAKLVLNALTTAAMIRIGKVHDHWMVDLKLSSRKLRLRAQRIVMQLGGVAAKRAEKLLGQADGSVKLAVVMAKTGATAADGRRRLRRAGGILRAALEAA